MEQDKKRPKYPHWYKIYSEYCPVCGREDIFRIRQYSERPKEWEARHEFKEVYDWCLG